MSKETKVGLVVGLGFIVMFAVILSKKAGTVPYAELERDIAIGGEGTLQVVDSATTHDPIEAAQPALEKKDERFVQTPLPLRHDEARDSGPSASSTGASISTAKAAQKLAYPGLNRRDISNETIALPAVDARPGADAAQDEAVAARQPAAAVVKPPAVVKPMQSAVADPAPSPAPMAEAPVAEAPAKQVAVQPKPERKADPVEKNGIKVVAPKTKPTRSSPLNDRKPKLKEYIAQADDTLYKIARKHGAPGLKGAEEIFLANKDRLKDMNTLKIGQHLRIPKDLSQLDVEIPEGLPGAMVRVQDNAKQASAIEKAKPSAPLTQAIALKKVPAEKITEKPEQKYRPYEVKENETFSTIAEREMGTMHLWKALHRANKDKVPTPEKLRAGLKIRIPLNMIAHNGADHDGEE